MRVISSPVYIEAFRALGANPIVVDSAEIYLSMQQKVVDGLEYPVPDMIAAKLYEVSKFMSLTGHVTDFFVVSMNKPLWDGMSAEQQGIMTQAMKTATDWEWQAQPATTREALTKLGTLMQINDISAANRDAFAQKTQVIYGQFEASIGKGRDGPRDAQPERGMTAKVAVLDDWQGAARSSADWTERRSGFCTSNKEAGHESASD